LLAFVDCMTEARQRERGEARNRRDRKEQEGRVTKLMP
jgi:hypothetical protein